MPHVIPGMREWNGASGFFSLSASSRVLVDPASGDALCAVAQVFVEDFTTLTGRSLPIVEGGTPDQGDIVLSLAGADQGLGQEGYSFTIGDSVAILAPTTTGVFYATRSLLQMLLSDAAKSRLPRGSARDYPAYKERGFMLDVGRKFFPLSQLKAYARAMSWFKLNDFHLHLNDNELNVGTGPDWPRKYAAFRLDSPQFPGLAAKDGAYTKQEMRELQDFAKRFGVTITPEIDVPAHALAITQFKPELSSPRLDKSMLDLSNPHTLPFVESLWDEFLPWFDAAQVHIGADEYAETEGESYRQFVNACHDYLKSMGRTVHAWGSLAHLKGATQVHSDVVIDLWENDFANAPETVRDGHHVVNVSDKYLYIVPRLGNFQDTLDTRLLYEQWAPSIFDLHDASQNLTPDDPHLLGAKFAVWNDMLGTVITDSDVATRFMAALPTIGEKFWGASPTGTSYSQFLMVARTVAQAPGLDLRRMEALQGGAWPPQVG